MSIDSQQEPDSKAASSSDGSRLGPKLSLEGEFKASEALAIFGEFKGSISNPKQPVVIANSAEVHADITASTIKVQGKVRGNILGINRVELTSTADLVGKLQTREVKVEEGAVFRGEVNVITDESPTKD